MFRFGGLLATLFLLNGLGAFIAMWGVWRGIRWWGWPLGLLMAGGAAIVKIAMIYIPGVGALLLGRPPGMGQFRSQFPHGGPYGNGGPRGHFFVGHLGSGPGPMHGILPLFTNMGTLATMSIVIELAFVVLAIYALAVERVVVPSAANVSEN